ncbi:hypothetical protein K7432_006592 [Basidiobolus ranarum]|uniref:Uncharacterized protein n=1 Tax=Basidiobolus ranarum TaxID=34480 RepID=A0ABR2WUM3_9FUNG
MLDSSSSTSTVLPFVNGSSGLGCCCSLLFWPPYEARTRFALMQIYRAQRVWHAKVGKYTDELSELDIEGPPLGECTDYPIIEMEGDAKYEAKIRIGNGRVGHIRQDRYLWFDLE